MDNLHMFLAFLIGCLISFIIPFLLHDNSKLTTGLQKFENEIRDKIETHGSSMLKMIQANIQEHEELKREVQKVCIFKYNIYTCG